MPSALLAIFERIDESLQSNNDTFQYIYFVLFCVTCIVYIICCTEIVKISLEIEEVFPIIPETTGELALQVFSYLRYLLVNVRSYVIPQIITVLNVCTAQVLIVVISSTWRGWLALKTVKTSISTSSANTRLWIRVDDQVERIRSGSRLLWQFFACKNFDKNIWFGVVFFSSLFQNLPLLRHFNSVIILVRLWLDVIATEHVSVFGGHSNPLQLIRSRQNVILLNWTKYLNAITYYL